MTPEFQQGFQDELENIRKEAWLPLAATVAPTVGFAGYDAYKAVKEQAAKGPRSEELKQKSYLTEYPSVGLLGTAMVPHWALGKGMEALGRRGDTPFHKAMSAGAGVMGGITASDPIIALQKSIGL